MQTHTTNSPQQTMAIGHSLARRLKPGSLVVFSGGLGAGKTTFCRGLAEGLGCIDAASSPTFAIAQLYRGPIPMAHFDAYRISSEEDLETAGFYDYLEQGAVVALEWGENVAHLLQPPFIRVSIETLGQTTRSITIEEVDGA